MGKLLHDTPPTFTPGDVVVYKHCRGVATVRAVTRYGGKARYTIEYPDGLTLDAHADNLERWSFTVFSPNDVVACKFIPGKSFVILATPTTMRVFIRCPDDSIKCVKASTLEHWRDDHDND